MECPQNQELFAFVLGEVAQDRMREVVEHCRYCPKCSRRLGTICELGVAKPHLMRMEFLEECLGNWDPPMESRGADVSEPVGREFFSGSPIQQESRVFLAFKLVLVGVFVLLGVFAYSIGKNPSDGAHLSALSPWKR